MIETLKSGSKRRMKAGASPGTLAGRRVQGERGGDVLLTCDVSRDVSRDVRRYEEVETDARYDSNLSYDVSGDYAGDKHVARAVAEARRTVDRALNNTVDILIFRYLQYLDIAAGGAAVPARRAHGAHA